jgi:glycosyltransferase involved in cell wall biosynthesis
VLTSIVKVRGIGRMVPTCHHVLNMSLNGWRLIALSLDYPHHAGGSGYSQLVRQIDFDSVIAPPSGPIAIAYDRFVRKTAGIRAVSRLTRRRIATEAKYFASQLGRKPRLVHALYGEHHSWLLRLLPKGRAERRVLTIHLPPALWHVAFRPGQLDRIDSIILMSESQLEPLRKELKYPGRVTVVPHGVDTTRFPFAERSAVQRNIVCVMVGNFLRDYQALADVANACRDKPVVFHVVANNEVAGPVEDLPNVVRHRNITDDRLVELYHEAHIAIFTMKDCTANNALLEAMSTGLPILANDVGGVRTYVDESICQFIQPDKPLDVAEAIVDLAQDEARMNAMGRAARERAESFSWAKIAQRTLEVYREAIG